MLALALLAPAFAVGFDPIVVEVEIRAPPEVVWEVMTDLDAYSEWNPWVLSASGPVIEGQALRAEVALNDGTRRVGHTITVVDEHATFCWQDRGAFTLLAKGWRCRTLEPVGWKTAYRMELQVVRPMAGFVERRYGESLRAGAEAEAAALAERAEAAANARSGGE